MPATPAEPIDVVAKVLARAVPSRRPVKLRRMLVATLHCSDPACDAELEVEIEDLRELDGWPCDCGYGLVLLSVIEPIPVHARSANGGVRATH